MLMTRRRTIVQALVAAFAAANVPSLVLSAVTGKKERSVDHVIVIKGLLFTPKSVSVRVGDTITWINQDIAPHTATADDHAWDTGNLKRGEKATIKVTENFSEQYYCRFHPMMTANVILSK